MKHLLAPLVGDASPVTVIGLCKNAGKTTAMPRLVAELGEERRGVASAGRDAGGSGKTGKNRPNHRKNEANFFKKILDTHGGVVV